MFPLPPHGLRGMKIQDYLRESGAVQIKEVRPFLFQFQLPGDSHPAGRASTTRDGLARIWHRGSREGLQLSEAWSPATPVTFKNYNGQEASVPSYTANLADLKAGESITKVQHQQAKMVARDDDVRTAALSLLDTQAGWKLVKQHGEISYLNDGNGSTPACRLVVKNGIASAWSFRSDIDLPAPWREGQRTASGEKTMFATARDLGVAATEIAAPRPSLATPTPAALRRQEVDEALAAEIVNLHRAGAKAPADHRHLIKKGVQLEGAGLREIPAFSMHAGDLLVPMFRPTGQGLDIEVSGGQRLCKNSVYGTDKMLISGSKMAESFVPFPVSPLLENCSETGKASMKDWLEVVGPVAKFKPLVVCEGVADALAIHESGAGVAVAGISSNNVPAVTKFLKESGIADHFQSLVVATDYDLALKDGKPKSLAVQKALRAAYENGAKVAIPPAGSAAGTDARDLLAAGGGRAVRDYINEAAPPLVVAAREDVKAFLKVVKEKKSGLER